MPCAEGEAMLVDARREEAGKSQRTTSGSTVKEGSKAAVSSVFGRSKATVKRLYSRFRATKVELDCVSGQKQEFLRGKDQYE